MTTADFVRGHLAHIKLHVAKSEIKEARDHTAALRRARAALLIESRVIDRFNLRTDIQSYAYPVLDKNA